MTRFGQPDIIRGSANYPSSQNRYAYVWNDPVNLVDRNGLLPSVVAESNATAANIAAHNADVDKREAAKRKKAAESAYEVAQAAVLGMSHPDTIKLAQTNEQISRAIGKANERIKEEEARNGPLSEERKNAIFAEECWNVTEGYKDYWNRQDGYFEDAEGWNVYSYDSPKVEEARTIMDAMILGSGNLNVADEQGTYFNGIDELILRGLKTTEYDQVWSIAQMFQAAYVLGRQYGDLTPEERQFFHGTVLNDLAYSQRLEIIELFRDNDGSIGYEHHAAVEAILGERLTSRYTVDLQQEYNTITTYGMSTAELAVQEVSKISVL